MVALLFVFLTCLQLIAAADFPRSNSVASSSIHQLLRRNFNKFAVRQNCPSEYQTCGGINCCSSDEICCIDTVGGCCPKGSTCNSDSYTCSAPGGEGGGNGAGGGGGSSESLTSSLSNAESSSSTPFVTPGVSSTEPTSATPTTPITPSLTGSSSSSATATASASPTPSSNGSPHTVSKIAFGGVVGIALTVGVGLHVFF